MILGTEQTFELDGKVYRLGRFERRHTDQLVEWANRKLPDPLRAVMDRLKDFPPEYHKTLISEAVSQCARVRTLSNSQVQEQIASEEGVTEALVILFKDSQRDATDADARATIARYAERHGLEPLADLLARCAGKKD